MRVILTLYLLVFLFMPFPCDAKKCTKVLATEQGLKHHLGTCTFYRQELAALSRDDERSRGSKRRKLKEESELVEVGLLVSK
jgi:hypothetical protein